ncbi:MAG: type II secretion system minor pseudopilin GspJ [Kangiellaceae bacterium]|nr:type II secretion system minor pseudopilin GspJ [Kangiellaceae bacterium]
MINFHSNRQSGFTLLEIVVAMAIAALIGVGAMRVLDSATLTHKNIQKTGTRYNDIERALLFLSNDLQQLAPRQFRDEFGDKKDNLFSDDSAGKTFLSFTRLGRRNPAKLARSNLEKLVYMLEDSSLQRISYLYPDGMNVEQGLARTLLENVESFKIDFFDGEEWNDFWPVENGGDETDSSANSKLPVAIKISLELEDLGLIERLFVISDKRKDSDG